MQRRNTLPVSTTPLLRNDYEVLESIGANAFAAQYRVRDRSRGALSLLEVVHPWLAEGWIHRRLLVRQLKTLTAAAGANLVRVIEAGQTQDGVPYWLRAVDEGETLRELVAHEGPLSETLLTEIGDQILAALEQAHAHRVLHRSLTPDDVLVIGRSLPQIRVKGFGLASVFKSARLPGPSATADDLLHRAPFLSPEEFLDEPIDARSDVYSAGALLYFMATGQAPLSIDSPEEIVATVIKREPAPPRASQAARISSAVEGVIMQALAKYPEDRFAGAGAMRDALRSRPAVMTPALRPRERARRSPRPPIGLRTVLATASVAGVLLVISLLIPEMTASAKPLVMARNLPTAPVAETSYTIVGEAHMRSGHTLLLDEMPVSVAADGSFAVDVPVPPGTVEHELHFRGSDGVLFRNPVRFAITGVSPPSIEVLQPPENHATRRDQITFEVRADRELSSAAVDDQSLTVAGTSARGSIKLRAGANALRLGVVDRFGRVAERLVTVERKSAPHIEITSPAPGSHVSRVIVAGRLTDADGLRVVIGEREVPVRDGAFEVEVPAPDGPLAATLQVVSPDGVEAEAALAVNVDHTPPQIVVSAPPISAAVALIKGVVTDAAPGELESLSVNDRSVAPAADGSFEMFVPNLTEGTHAVMIKAVDRAHNVREQTVAVTIDTTPPTLSIAPADASVRVVHDPTFEVRLVVTDAHPARVLWQSDHGERGEAIVGEDGGVAARLPLSPGGNRFEIVAVDQAGLQSGAEQVARYFSPAATIAELRTDLVSSEGERKLSVQGTATAPLWRAEVNAVRAAVRGSHFEALLGVGATDVLIVLWDRAGARAEYREPIRPEAALEQPR
ncbi:MAG: protein kinase [Planctomycetota bacterium]